MDLSSNGMIEVGLFYDQINDIIVVLDDKFNIQNFNQYTLKFFKSTEKPDLIGLNFNNLMRSCNLQISIDENKKTINNNSLLINNELKRLKIIFGTFDNKPVYYLLSQTLIEIKETYKVLAKASKKQNPQTSNNFLYAKEYVDEIKTFFENIIRQMPCYVYWKDEKFRYVFINDLTAKIMELKSPDEAIGKTDYDFGWDRKLVDTYRATDAKIFNTGVPVLNLEEDLIDKNGRVYHTLVNKLPLKNSVGEIIGILGITVDISNIKEIELQLKKAKIAAEAGEKAKTEFIANVSHDMRTPLSGIVSLTHQLEDALDECTIKKIITQIGDSGDALFEMFVEILDDVAAAHMIEKDIELEVFDINHVIHNIAKLEKPSLTNKGLEFIYNIDKNIPVYLIGDRRKIHRIILNLFGNAIKFTKKGHVEIQIELIKKHDDNITLKFNVIDTGIGVPNNSKQHLFERFYKASPSFKGEYKGFGLGLHIAKVYTYLLGGEISFTSEEGSGSDFYAILPFKIANKKQVALYKKKLTENKPSLLKVANKLNLKDLNIKLKPQENQEHPANNIYHILVVEDNIMARIMLVNYIKAANLQYTEADNGESALELAKNQHFDLILADVGLPGISGTELAQKLRQFEKENNKQAVPIVGVTAHAATGRNECLDAGMSAVTPKPLLKETFDEILQEFLPSHKNKT